jgi:Na+-driven multidrug efflux pump
MTCLVTRQPSRTFDRFASAWAIGCAIHCLALPLLLFAVPSLYLALYSFHAPHRALAMTLLRLISLEPWFVGAGALISAVAMARGAWHHRRAAPAALASLGILALFASWYAAGSGAGWMHPVGVACGAAALVVAHAWNLRHLRLFAARKRQGCEN